MFNNNSLIKTFHQAIRFSIIGFCGVLINYGIFILALVVFKIHYLISGVMGYLIGGIPIYLLHRYWTFKSDVSIFKGFPIYVVINLFSLSSHSSIQYVSKEYFNVPEIYSQAYGISVSVIISFILVRKLMNSTI